MENYRASVIRQIKITAHFLQFEKSTHLHLPKMAPHPRLLPSWVCLLTRSLWHRPLLPHCRGPSPPSHSYPMNLGHQHSHLSWNHWPQKNRRRWSYYYCLRRILQFLRYRWTWADLPPKKVEKWVVMLMLM